jgi:8-oxo-dGTP pyrophosphatase MutT (NUDIX family)
VTRFRTFADGKAPPDYREAEDDPEPKTGEGLAAVAVVLRPGTVSTETLLIRRARCEGDPWSGHIAFPGGRKSSTDRSLLETAVREAREETGIDLTEPVGAVGRLEPVRPESVGLPSLCILPLVFPVAGSTSARAASSEVDEAFWVPISQLQDPGSETVHRVEIGSGAVRSFPAVSVADQVIWGLTRRILRDLLSRLR